MSALPLPTPTLLQQFAPLAQEEGAVLLLNPTEDGTQSRFASKPLAVLRLSGTQKNAGKILDEFLFDHGLWLSDRMDRVAMGYFSYEWGRNLLPKQSGKPNFHAESLAGFPDLWLGVYDHTQEHVVTLPPCNPLKESFPDDLQRYSNFSRYEFEAAVTRILDYIRAGDLYQANLAQRFTLPLKNPDPYQHFQNLLQQNPAPYSAYLRLDHEHAIISCSPEKFLTVRDQQIVTEPIKGTIARGLDPKSDEANRLTLRQSAKNLAELTMIVDLLRNDLGKICLPSSIQAPRSPQLKTFASVHHLIGRIEGKLRPELFVSQILAATFPGGSITGAPKLRATQVIAELEDSPRGVYCGAIGTIGPGKNLDFNIAIRTLMVSGNYAYLHAGAGIVAESQPGLEYEETLAKISPFLKELIHA